MRMDRIIKTQEFLKTKLETSPYFITHPEEGRYRYEHSLRVSHIGQIIAQKEGMDEEALIIACLLHDVSYCKEYTDKADYINHGRYSASISRPFLKDLGFDDYMVNQMCYGIAIHVDDQADFEGERNAFTESIGEADNIDRFDAYREFDLLLQVNFQQMNLEERTNYLTQRIEKFKKFMEIKSSNATSDKMLKENLMHHIDFLERLLKQDQRSITF